MKKLKLLLIIVTLVTVVAVILGCSPPDGEETVESQIAKVILGNLTLDITAAGNLALAHTEDLAIDLIYPTGTKGTVAEVLVEEGDSVEEGQLLVVMDTAEWDDYIDTLADTVNTRQRAVTQAQINVKTAQQNLKNANDNVATKELAVLNAQISVDQAQATLAAGITAVDYNLALAEYYNARSWYDYVQNIMDPTSLEPGDYELTLERAQERLDVAKTNYDNVLAGYDTSQVTLKKKQLESAERALAAAEEDLADVSMDVSLKELSLTLTQGNLEDAEKAVTDALKDLEDAEEKSPEIRAPFDGFITQVNVEGGDEVLKGTVAVQLADPNKFEADILVSEMDILQVSLGSEAFVEVDAMQGMSIPATVTHIAPTATIQSGVVNYVVKVELESLESMAEGRQGMRQQMMENLASGELPPFLQMAVDEGRMTEEEAKKMMEEGPPEGFTPGEGFTPPEGFEPPEGFTPPEGMEFPGMSGDKSEGQLPVMELPEEFQLREGLTVTVSIIVAERTDVLLVPNAAVITEGTQSYVHVLTSTGELEKRTVQTGLSDYQYTEITEGLSEGEDILIDSGIVATESSSEEERPRMGLFGPR